MGSNLYQAFHVGCFTMEPAGNLAAMATAEAPELLTLQLVEPGDHVDPFSGKVQTVTAQDIDDMVRNFDPSRDNVAGRIDPHHADLRLPPAFVDDLAKKGAVFVQSLSKSASGAMEAVVEVATWAADRIKERAFRAVSIEAGKGSERGAVLTGFVFTNTGLTRQGASLAAEGYCLSASILLTEEPTMPDPTPAEGLILSTEAAEAIGLAGDGDPSALVLALAAERDSLKTDLAEAVTAKTKTDEEKLLLSTRIDALDLRFRQQRDKDRRSNAIKDGRCGKAVTEGVLFSHALDIDEDAAFALALDGAGFAIGTIKLGPSGRTPSLQEEGGDDTTKDRALVLSVSQDILEGKTTLNEAMRDPKTKAAYKRDEAARQNSIRERRA